MHTIKSILISLLVLFLLFPFLRYLLTRIIPAKRQSFHLTQEEMEHFRRKEWLLILIHTVLTVVMAILITSILTVVASFKYNDTDKLMYALTPNFTIFMIPGLLLGMSLSVIPLILLQKAMLEEEFILFENYTHRAYGFDIRKFGITALLVVGLVSAVTIYFQMHWFVQIKEEQVVVKKLLEEPKVYAYDEVQELRQENDNYIVEFKDGTRFSTEYLQPERFEMIAYLASKTGLQLQR